MTDVAWPQRELPPLSPATSTVWTGEAATIAGVTALRRQLRAAAGAGAAACCAAADDVDRLLLAFEELTSNALRHGCPPARVVVTGTATGWLLDVSDAAVDRPPRPAVERDPAEGGLGLYLVARMCAAHGWLVENGRKHVWAQLVCAAEGTTDEVTERLRATVTDLTKTLPRPPAVHVTGGLDDLREDLVTDLFAVLHESLTNVARHAHACTAEVDLTVGSDTVTLQVVDDGVGMQAAPRDGGLADLRRRAIWHGGTLSLGPGTSGGTRLTWTVPRRGRSRGGAGGDAEPVTNTGPNAGR